MLDLHDVMRGLRGKRPIFHSEADFQHALAMELEKYDQVAQVRLEYRPLASERIYLDMWVQNQGRKYSIELKYKTRAISVDWQDERFDLANQGAQELGSYDVWKDVQRLEHVCSRRSDVDGFVILLSNDSAYWNEPTGEGTVGSAFRLHESRVVSGGLFWASHAGEGTMKKREKPIALQGSYRISWHDYSRLGPEQGLTFRYTIIPIPGEELSKVKPTKPEVQQLPTQPIPMVVSFSKKTKYSPLYDYLVSIQDDRVELSYYQIEKIIGSSLPPSSRTHPSQFWANHYGGTHVWATKWMDAGWKVDSHNVGSERVVFVRVSKPAKTSSR